MHGSLLKPTIATASGRYFNFLSPDHTEIALVDISTGLANTCRFGGQCQRFYSVAEHCVLMSYIVPEGFERMALMHDAAEAYTGDIPKPLKQLLPDFAVIEERVEAAVAYAFCLPEKMPPEIKLADRQMLCAEQMQVMGNTDEWVHTQSTEPAQIAVQFWSPSRAKKEFSDRFKALRTKQTT